MDDPSEAAPSMTLSDLNDFDDIFVTGQPDGDDSARPLLGRQRSWNAVTCNFPTGTYWLERLPAAAVPAVRLECVRQDTSRPAPRAGADF
ncbi:hypothetical protein AB0N56_36760 [Streptomyces microflavus]|uniref:hypothetical protein n=1 Tax=Streptomyces microflavus TaxID=1919 RepID=UPI003421BB3A